jgi:hypothetical protein
MAAKLHLAENALALHLLLERLEGLVDIIVANENLHAEILSWGLGLSGHRPGLRKEISRRVRHASPIARQ